MTLRDRVRDRAASLAAEAGVTTEHISKAHIRKEDVVARVLEQRGDRPRLVHILSAMEDCDAYKPGLCPAARHSVHDGSTKNATPWVPVGQVNRIRSKQELLVCLHEQPIVHRGHPTEPSRRGNR